jgi:hypothetical protein
MRARSVRILLCFAAPLIVFAQSPVEPSDAIDPIAPVIVPTAPPLTHDRILGIIPNFQTVNDPTKPYVPLRVREKWLLFVRETVDPYTFASVAAGAGISQWHNDDPKYGNGFRAYMQRFGAAEADIATQNFFSDAVLASFFHEDPRYFRKGPGSPVFHRIVYAMSRVVITRRDSGKDGFNFSGILGMGMGIGLSNAYYPPASVNALEMGSRVGTSLISSALGNLLPEFWPDVRAKLARYRHQ